MEIPAVQQSVSRSNGLKLAWKWSWLKFAMLPLLLILGPGGGATRVMDRVSNRAIEPPLTQAVERKTVDSIVTANGIVEAQRSINLSPKTAGVIKQLFVKEGDRVRRGQVIAIMDDANLRGQLIQSQGQLAQQQANLQRLQAGNRSEDIAKAAAQLAEVQANLQRLQAGNRPEDIAKAAAQLTEAQANLRQLQTGNRPSEIAQAAARLQQTQATLKLRESELNRYQQLAQDGAISQQTLDQKRADREVASSQVQEAQQALALQQSGTRPEQIDQAKARVDQQAQALSSLKAGSRWEDIAQAQAKVDQQTQTLASLKAGNRWEDIAQAQAQVQAAQGSLQTIQQQLQETQVTAPFDGIVLEKYADIGAFVSPSMGGGTGASASSSSILTLANDRNQVVVNIAESQISKIKLDQAVTIKADAFPEETFTGKVEQISPQAKVSQNVTSLEVRIAIDDSSKTLLAGLNVETQFVVGQLQNILLVPNAAVVKKADSSGVYVLDAKNKSQFRAIQTGTTIGKKTEVKSGLQGDEKVLLSPPTAPNSRQGGLKLPTPTAP
jgi:HlyD family secretion protein